MKTAIDVIVPSMTFLLLTMVGMGLTREDFARLRDRPAVIVTGLAGPLVLLPPLALGLTWVFRAAADVTAGVLLIAACPIGGISNTWSYLARASTALSVTLTGLSCLLAGLSIPLLGRFFEFALGGSFRFEAPLGPLFAQMLIVLAVPVVVGMWVRSRFPGIAARHGPLLQRVAFSGIGVLLALIVLDDPRAFVADLSTTVPLAAAFVLSSMAVGWYTAVIATRDVRDRFTLAAEFGTRNTGVATVIAVTVLGRVEFARFAATYFVTEIPLMLAAVWLFRRYAAHGRARSRGSAAAY
jgi:BASS family bile acid:Na+ symporter